MEVKQLISSWFINITSIIPASVVLILIWLHLDKIKILFKQYMCTEIAENNWLIIKMNILYVRSTILQQTIKTEKSKFVVTKTVDTYLWSVSNTLYKIHWLECLHDDNNILGTIQRKYHKNPVTMTDVL